MNIKKIKTIAAGAAGIIKAKAFKKKIPLAVGWALTYRCNRRCGYCRLWDKKTDELTTQEIFRIVDELKKMGTLAISLTGGEPLLRDDIGDIISYASGKNIKVKLNSNGALVKEKIQSLNGLDILYLSLDGPRKIHDAIRGDGSWDDALAAARAARDQGIKRAFYTVLTRHNCACIHETLAIAREVGAKVYVQPVETHVLGDSRPHALTPSAGQMRSAIGYLIEQKNQNDPCVGNSSQGLRALALWPDSPGVYCASGQLTCRIEPDGTMRNCSRKNAPKEPLNCAHSGVAPAFARLDRIQCTDCWCASRIEINRLLKTDMQTIFEHARELFF